MRPICIHTYVLIRYIIIGLTWIFKTARETGIMLCITYVLDTLNAVSTHVYIAGIAQLRYLIVIFTLPILRDRSRLIRPTAWYKDYFGLIVVTPTIRWLSAPIVCLKRPRESAYVDDTSNYRSTSQERALVLPPSPRSPPGTLLINSMLSKFMF